MDEYILQLLQSKKVKESKVPPPTPSSIPTNLVISHDTNTTSQSYLSNTSNELSKPQSIINTDSSPPPVLTMDDIMKKLAINNKVINTTEEIKTHTNYSKLVKTYEEHEIKEENRKIQKVEEKVDEKTEEKVEEKTEEKEEKEKIEEKIAERELRIKNAIKQNQQNIPKIIFIVPYRNKSTQRNFYSSHMLKILEDFPHTYYKIYYIQHDDNREFNRGAMKNIGFLMIKNQYPTYYKNMTLVFNDIDVMPYNKDSINYDTTEGVINHFYGVKYALGGLFSIKASDFEKTNGFPNAWEWGYEDVIFKSRVEKEKLQINYSHFTGLNDGNMISLKDDNTKTRLEQRIPNKYNITRPDGLNSIYELNYVVNMEDNTVSVNNFSVNAPQTNRRIGMMF